MLTGIRGSGPGGVYAAHPGRPPTAPASGGRCTSGGQHSPFPGILDYLRPGDVITSRPAEAGSIPGRQRPGLPVGAGAMRNGAPWYVGHGWASLDFRHRRRRSWIRVMPDLISSDVHGAEHQRPRLRPSPPPSPVPDCWGCSWNRSWRHHSTPDGSSPSGVSLGRLEVGAPADISVLQLAEGEYTLVDSSGNRRRATRRLTAFATFRDGLPPGSPGLG